MKKRILSLILALVLILTGCAPGSPEQTTPSAPPEVSSLSDPVLLSYLEDTVYDRLVTDLSREDVFVENVQAVYISEEYWQELAYNSQENLFFGCSLADLDALFGEGGWLFTLGEDGETQVQAYVPQQQGISQVVEDVMVGSGVILLCVTVSAVAAALGPSGAAVSMIFAMSAKTGTIAALSGAAVGGAASAAVTAIRTGDLDRALEAAKTGAASGFQWGAIGGILDGGISAAASLKGAAMNGLTMNQAAQIQKASKLPLKFLKNFRSKEEYQVYEKAGLKLGKVNGKWAYTRAIDWAFVGDKADGRTNAQRVQAGLAPLDSTGQPYELHHIGQKADAPLAILTKGEHSGSYATLHGNTGGEESLIDRGAFQKEKEAFWEELLSMAGIE